MKTRWLQAVAMILAGVAATMAWGGCGDSGPRDPTAADAGTDADVWMCRRSTECSTGLVCIQGACVSPPPCAATAECPANMICTAGRCRVPTGRCDPRVDVATQCYPQARCASTDGVQGQCTVQPPLPAAPSFGSARTGIALSAPADEQRFASGQAVDLRWEPPATGAGQRVTVALIMDAVPHIDPGTGQVTARERIVWAWSSLEGGGTSHDGLVSLRDGRRGVLADGQLGPAWGRPTLEDGRYYWFVFQLRNGVVEAASPVRQFWIGSACGRTLHPTHECATAAACVDTVEYPELAGCGLSLDATAGAKPACLRHCASDADCCGDLACELERIPALAPAGGRRMGYCVPRS